MVLPPEYVNVFDALRTQLAQLSRSITLLRSDLQRAPTLPSWPELQQTVAMVGNQLNAVNTVLSIHRQLLADTHVYALPNFPGQDEEKRNLIEALLRKKLEMRAERWIDESLEEPRTVRSMAEGNIAPLTTEDINQLLKDASTTARRLSKQLWDRGRFDDDFTIAERKQGISNVSTGLKRKLGKRASTRREEDDSEGEDSDQGANGFDSEDDESLDEGDKMEEDPPVQAHTASAPADHGIDASRPGLSLNTLLKSMSGGGA